MRSTLLNSEQPLAQVEMSLYFKRSKSAVLPRSSKGNALIKIKKLFLKQKNWECPMRNTIIIQYNHCYDIGVKNLKVTA